MVCISITTYFSCAQMQAIDASPGIAGMSQPVHLSPEKLLPSCGVMVTAIGVEGTDCYPA